MQITKTGKLFIISAPSGAGKSTLTSMMLMKYKNVAFSVSFTTRKPRASEVDGVDYHFVSHATFKKMIADNEFLEWAKVHDNYYGTSLKTINKSLAEGLDLILDIDPQGAMQIKQKVSGAVYIFMMTPTFEVLRERLVKRGTDSSEMIELRIENAKKEVEYFREYDYMIINDESEKAFKDLESIYIAEKLKIN